jgi:hypothetical protein
MAEIEGSSEELANTLFKLGWRSADEVARAKLEELAGVPGVGGEAGAARIKEAAARQVEVEKQRRVEAERQAAEEAARAQAARKADEERLLQVRGVGENTLPALYRGGYTTVEKLNEEEDVNRLAESTGIGLKKARQLKHWVKVFLGEIDPSTPEPTGDDEGASAEA